MIRVTCPDCQFAREYPDHFAGQELPCRRCQTAVVVGGPDAVRVDETAEPGPIRRFAGAYAAAVLLVLAFLCFLTVWVEPRGRARPSKPLFGYGVFLAAFVGMFAFAALGAVCVRLGFRRAAAQPACNGAIRSA